MEAGEAGEKVAGAIKLAVVGYLVSIFIAAGQEWMKMRLEREQYESTLIVQAVNNADQARSRANLKFLIEAGLVSAHNEKILPLLLDSTMRIKLPADRLPMLPPTPAHYTTSTGARLRVIAGTVVDELTKRPLQGVRVSVDNKHERQEIVTGKDGQFRLNYLNGSYYFMLERPGYQIQNTIRTGRMTYPDDMVIELKRDNE